MSAPRMPGHTCPMIDKLKRRIESAYKSAARVSDAAGEDELRAILSDIAHELDGEADVLEDIRDANLALRNCAEYWQNEAEALQ
jgi:hypothetical protein